MRRDNPSRQDVDTDNRPRRQRRRARHCPRAWMVLVVTCILGVSVDLISKHLAFQYVDTQPVVLTPEIASNPATDPTRFSQPMSLLPGDVLALRLALNRGAVFGFGENQRLFFILFTLAACTGAIYVFTHKTLAHHRGAHLAIGLLMAGAIGNFYDRLAFHAVRDFIQFMPGRRLPDGWTWPGGNPEMFPWVFNIADVMLLAGMVGLMTYIRIKRSRVVRRNRMAAELQSSPGA